MKAVRVDYDREKDLFEVNAAVDPEDWVDVCEKYNNDVHRLRDAAEREGFSALYECFDDDNNSCYYLVEEDSSLFKARRKVFLENVGVKKESQP